MWSSLRRHSATRASNLRRPAIFAVAVALFTVWLLPDNTSARLVSIQESPDAGMCAWEPGSTGIFSDPSVTSEQMVSLARERSQQAGIFAALKQGLQQRNLFAAVQQGGGGSLIPALVELTHR